jgi:hippurate hydrolase
MTAADVIRGYADELIAIRRDIHAHPELGFEEFRTSELVATKLAEWGIEVHRNVGRTGVVGVLRKGNGQAAIGLRADMDALPIEEANGLPHASTRPGIMHACGHDGHTAMLLGAAKYLAESGTFNGTVNFIFQPAEEGLGGARAMLEDGLMDRFPMDSVFGIHTSPGLPLGQFSIRPGAMMAGGGFFDITVTGTGAHGAHPEDSADPVLAAATIAQALQSIVSRNVKPTDTAVVSLTWIESGAAYNVIPGTAVLRGTVRAYRREVIDLVESRMKRLAENIAASFGATAQVDFRYLFAPLVNDPREAELYADAAAALVGEANVDRNCPAIMASEDFSFMMEQRPGARINLGNGADSVPVHNAMFDFNDESLPLGAGVLATLVELKLPQGEV